MSRSRRRRRRAISRWIRKRPKASPTRSAARWRNIKAVTAVLAATERDALSLLSAQAVRSRARMMLEIGLSDGLRHFRIDLDRMGDVADAVLATIRKNYPSLDIPFHARWRHFSVNGVDRWAGIASRVTWPDR